MNSSCFLPSLRARRVSFCFFLLSFEVLKPIAFAQISVAEADVPEEEEADRSSSLLAPAGGDDRSQRG